MLLPITERNVLAGSLVAALVLGGGLLGQTVSLPGSQNDQAFAASKKASATKAKNAQAHAAFKKKLVKIRKANGTTDGPWYRFIDLTGDGVDEMVVQWWPAVYRYSSGKVKRINKQMVGRFYYPKAYKSKRILVTAGSDALGSMPAKVYLKWNGKKFVKMASLYTPCAYAKSVGNKASYWVKGKGQVTKKQAQAYVKKLVGKAKATKITYKRYEGKA